MTTPFIDLKAQYAALKASIDSRITAVLDHGQYIMGPEVQELEVRLSQYSGAKYCITVSSGTEALLISLMALGIEPGDEVITTPFTFVSTAEVIVRLGAIPVFVDIEPTTCNIDPNLIENHITSKTKAIIPVSLYGQTADMDSINEIARCHGNIPVIEDAAQSFGASYRQKKSCNLSLLACTSFFPSKPLGCYGDGGAIFTSDEGLAETCREIRIHGQRERYFHEKVGVGGRMDTIQCAIVLAKLENFDWEVKQRILIGEKYNELLDAQSIERVIQRDFCESVFAQYTIFSSARDALKNRLQSQAVPTAVHYPIPLNEQPAYKDIAKGAATPNASRISKRVMSLPMHPYLDDQEQKTVVSKLLQCL